MEVRWDFAFIALTWGAWGARGVSRAGGSEEVLHEHLVSE